MSELRVLPAWLDAGANALSGAAPPAPTLEGAMPGLARAQSLTPLQRLQRLQQADLAECGGAGEPVHLAWRQFLRGRGPSTLVIDATSFDARSRGAAAVLDGAPWLLAEGVLIAAGLRDSLDGRAAPAGGADRPGGAPPERRRLHPLARPDRHSPPAGEGAAREPAELLGGGAPRRRVAARPHAGDLVPDRPALRGRRRGPRRVAPDAPARHEPARARRAAARRAASRSQIDEWGGGGGGEGKGREALLVFDDGLGGFLPLSAADVSCEPLSLASAGIVPVPSTLMVQAEGVCVVKATRRALYRHWQLADDEEASVRGVLARAARLVAEITLGRGEVSHLAALDAMAMELATQGLAAAWPLGSSLRYYREQWERHVRRESCPEGVCLERRAAPCHGTCPANIDIPTFMAHLGNGDYRSTIEVIRRDNPLPQTCGYVCPAPCESACVRGSHDGAVFIRPMKSKAAEHCLAEGGYPKPEIAPDTGKRIGIVGSGPSSLTAAYYLRTLGHDVEIHEAQEHAGGMLRYGIPAYRNPPDLLEKEIDQIRALGVRIFCSSPVASVEEFRKRYDAVFLGLGTQKARLLPTEGAHLPFVLGGIDFLRAARSGEPVRVGPRVVVIGGGNVSIDVALTALRQGARHVDLTSLDKRRDLPASPGEIELAVAEGVQLRPGWGPLRFEEEGVAVFQFCEKVKDETGRFVPVFDGNRLLTLEVDHVILATGQGTDLACLEGSGVENTRGFIVADPKTKMTNVPGVFAGGDGQHGPRTAVESIRSGKIAAASIDAWLRGVPVDEGLGLPVRRAEVTPLPVLADDPHSPAPRHDAREDRRGDRRRGQLREDRGGPDRRDGERRGPPLPALRHLHRLRPLHGRLQRDGRRGAAHGRHAGRPPRPLRLPAARRAVHRLRRLHAGLPDGSDPSRRPGRCAADGHHRHRREGAASPDLRRVRCADADARAPGLRSQAPAGSHGGPARSRALPVLRAPPGRPSRDRGERPCVRKARRRLSPWRKAARSASTSARTRAKAAGGSTSSSSTAPRGNSSSGPVLAGETENPSYLALHPNGLFLYAVNELQTFEGKPTGAVSAFSIDPATGRLTFLNVCLERRAAPCQAACPANIDIPTFMAHLGNGDHRATVEVIRQDNPLPQTCGYVCPAPCESACVRGSHDGAVFIRPMKSRAAEHCLAEGGYPKPAIAPDTGKRIGMVGSGPSSLTAAYYLRTLGHDVEIHEAQEHAGGMLRYGIPAYRNPPDAFEKEVDQIRALGVRIFTGSPVASVEEFRKRYDAVYLGLGTQLARLLPVEGSHLPFVLGGIDFLRAARSGGSVRVGPRVVVIGGGNVAIDVALTALRQGARHVDLTSLEKRREMPASPGEIELAVAEGVQLHPGWGPLRFEEEGLAVFQYCERVKDETGRFDPKFDGNRLLSLEADHVILATGQGTDLACLEGSGVENTRGFIVADPKTKMTKVPGVFAGGDGQHGPRTAVEAIRSGKIAAAAIDAFLRGAPVDAGVGLPVRRAEVTPLSVPADVPFSQGPRRDAREVRRGDGRRGQLREDRGGPDRPDGARRGPPLPALRRLHRLRPLHGRLQRDGRRGAAHGRHGRRAPRPLRLPPARRAVHRLRRLHAGLPDGSDPPRRPRRGAPDGHHRHRREGAASPHLRRVRCADADARAPGLRSQAPSGPHGGPARSRALSVLRAPAGRSSRGGGERPCVRKARRRLSP